MSTAVADPHQRFRSAVTEAAATLRAFGGPPRRDVGWEEVRAAWAAGPSKGRPTPWDAWVGSSARVPLSQKFAGKGDVPRTLGAGAPLVLRSVPVETWKCACELPSANGRACADGGVTEDATGWTYNAVDDVCEALTTCKGGEPCACYETGASQELSVSAGTLTAGIVRDACGMDGEEKSSCAEVQCVSELGACKCKVWCVAKGNPCTVGSWKWLNDRWSHCLEGAETSPTYGVVEPACAMPWSLSIEESLEEAALLVTEATTKWEDMTGTPFWGDGGGDYSSPGKSTRMGSALQGCESKEPKQRSCDWLVAEEKYEAGSRKLEERASVAWMAKQPPGTSYTTKRRATEGPCSIHHEYEVGSHYKSHPFVDSIGCCPCCHTDSKSYWMCKFI